MWSFGDSKNRLCRSRTPKRPHNVLGLRLVTRDSPAIDSAEVDSSTSNKRVEKNSSNQNSSYRKSFPNCSHRLSATQRIVKLSFANITSFVKLSVILT